MEAGDGLVCTASEPCKKLAIEPEKSISAAGGSGLKLGSLVGGGHIVGWPLGTLAQALNSSIVGSSQAADFSIFFSPDSVGRSL